MSKLFPAILVMSLCAQAQSVVPAASRNADAERTRAGDDGLFSPHIVNGKVGLVRGILVRFDPIFDQLVVHTFGGGDVRIGFDQQTKFLPEKANSRLPGISAGSVVSVDTVMDNGKPFALSVRTDTPSLSELNGQVVAFDPTRSRLTLHDLTSPEGASLRITPSTVVVDRGQPASPSILSPGMLVRAWFSAGQDAANKIEVLAKPGSTFAFQGRIIAMDLRLRVLSLLNDTDQSIRELTFSNLANNRLALLREGAEVAIEAEFDGQRYNVRSVALVPATP